MAGNDRPDPADFIGSLMRVLQGFVEGGASPDPGDSWRRATEPKAEAPKATPAVQRENLAFALATRAVEALEDIALNLAAVRQRIGGADVLNPANKRTEYRPGLEDEPRAD